MADEFILEVRNLKKYFPAGRPGWFSRGDTFVHAVDDVDLNLKRGEVIALVGESGCGKSTLSLTLMGLEQATAGTIFFEGKDITHLNEKERKAVRQRIQMIFQDPYESLNPTQTIEEIVSEPLAVHGLSAGHDERRERVLRALEDSGLKPAEDYLHRYPHQLSGGQRQRVVIAGALVLEPHLLLADEPVSMLDVSIRAEIINLLADLQKSRGISVIFITHDLGTVGYFADRVAVMYLGVVVELASRNELYANPLHPYSQALLSAVPVPDPVVEATRKRTILVGDVPSPANPPSGCRFRTRCPIAQAVCAESRPEFREVKPGHFVACHLVS